MDPCLLKDRISAITFLNSSLSITLKKMACPRCEQQIYSEEGGQNLFIPFFYHQQTSQMIEHAHKEQVFSGRDKLTACNDHR